MGSEINALSKIYDFLLYKDHLLSYILTTKLRLSICTSPGSIYNSAFAMDSLAVSPDYLFLQPDIRTIYHLDNVSNIYLYHLIQSIGKLCDSYRSNSNLSNIHYGSVNEYVIVQVVPVCTRVFKYIEPFR